MSEKRVEDYKLKHMAFIPKLIIRGEFGEFLDIIGEYFRLRTYEKPETGYLQKLLVFQGEYYGVGQSHSKVFYNIKTKEFITLNKINLFESAHFQAYKLNNKILVFGDIEIKIKDNPYSNYIVAHHLMERLYFVADNRYLYAANLSSKVPCPQGKYEYVVDAQMISDLGHVYDIAVDQCTGNIIICLKTSFYVYKKFPYVSETSKLLEL